MCNLGSVNLGASTSRDGERSTGSALRATVRTAVPFLDRVIDINYYPTEEAGGVQPAVAPGRARA